MSRYAIPLFLGAALLAAAQSARGPGPAAIAADVLKVASKAPPLPAPAGAVIRVADVPSLRKAVAEAAPGTTILLADGVYHLDELLVTGHNLTIRGASGDREKVVLDGGGKFTRVVRVRGAKDLTIADLTVANSRQYGIFFLGDSGIERLKVYNVKFHNCYVRGLKGTMATRSGDSGSKLLSHEEARRVRPKGGEVRYCLFVNDDVTPNDEPYGGDYVSGIDAMWLQDWTIADNTFVNIRGQHGGGRGAIFVWVNSENVVAERNLIVNCDRGICFGNPSGDPVHMTGGVIRDNFIVAGAGQGIEVCRTRDTSVVHNTVFSERPGHRVVQFHQLAGGGNRFLNNLLSGVAAVPDDVAAAGNIAGAIAEWFVNARAGDLRLTPKAAAGGAGARR
jgi:nitrous oxidase accessory protein NosD